MRLNPKLRHPRHALTTLIALALLVAMTSQPSQAQSSQRADAAAARVRPLLEPLLGAQKLSFGAPVFIRIFKQERVLEMWLRQPDSKTYQLCKSWPVAGMSGVLGPKLAEGDRQAPEGFYEFGRGALNPQSNFHLSFNIGYPNAYDRAHQRTGSLIMVHGSNLSAGCFAMTDPAIEEIYTLCAAALDAGQTTIPVHIFPFHLTEANLAANANHPHANFWQELKPAYDAFNTTRIPPTVVVSNGRYSLR